MTDIDRIVRDSLTTAAESFREPPAGLAQRRFEDLRRRRSRVHFVATAALVALAVGATSVVVARQDPSTEDSLIASPEVRAVPGEMVQTATIPVAPNPTSIDTAGDKVYVGHAEGGVVSIIHPDRSEVACRSYIAYEAASNAHLSVESDFLEVEGGEFWAAGNDGIGHGPVGGSCPYQSDPAQGGWMATSFVRTTDGETTDLVVGPEAVYVGGTATSEPGKYAVLEYQPRDLSDDTADLSEVTSTPQLDYGNGSLWYTQRGEFAFGPGPNDGLFRFDLEDLVQAGQSRVASEEVFGPTDVSVGAGAAWVYDVPISDVRPDHYFRGLVGIDPAGSEVTERVPIPGYSGWVEATDDLGVFVMAQIREKEWKLFRVDPATGNVLGEPLEFGAGPFSMTSGFKSLWIADEGEDMVYRVEIATRVPAALETRQPDETARPDGEPEGSVIATPDEVTKTPPDTPIQDDVFDQDIEAQILADIAAVQPEGLPTEIRDWIRPSLVLLYREGDRYHGFFEEISGHPCPAPAGELDTNSEARTCLFTAVELTFDVEGGLVEMRGGHSVKLPLDWSEDAVLLWSNVPAERIIGIDAPSACDRAFRWEPTFSCRNGEMVYTGE